MLHMRKEMHALAAQANLVRDSAMNSRAREYEAQTRTASLERTTKGLDEGIERHEEAMELSETLFAKQRDDDDLGESQSTDAAVPPVQAELNYEKEALSEAQAEIEDLRAKRPTILREQMDTDKKMFGKALGLAEKKLKAVRARFVKTAARLSPKIKSQHALDESLRDEQSRQSDFQRSLHNMAAFAKMVNIKEKSAQEEAEGNA